MNDADAYARILSDTSAYAHREYRSISVYTYSRELSGNTKCTVSACNKAPGCVAFGRSVASCGLFRGECFFNKWQRESVRWTEHNDTDIPSATSSRWMTCPQRRRPTRFLMMAYTMSRESARGDVFGFDDCVGIILHPPVGSFAHHFTMALCVYPRCRATFLVDHPFCFTRYTASRRTLGRCGFLLYAIYAILRCRVIPSY